MRHTRWARLLDLPLLWRLFAPDISARPPLRLEDGLLLGPSFAAMRDYYRFAALPDGFPGRREDDGTITAHPIYGAYLLIDYARELANPLARRHRATYRKALREIAEAALARMERLPDGQLVFFYDQQGPAGARLDARHYSALTSGYYAASLARAAQILGDQRLASAARDAYRAMLIPVSAGGVLVEHADGPSLCEVPQAPDGLILNGWLSALASILDYSEAAGDSAARLFVERSVERLEGLLPRYDLPELANSRYGLTGPTRLRLSSSVDGAILREALWRLPDGTQFNLVPLSAGPWTAHLDPERLEAVEGGWRLRERSVIARVVVSLAEDGQHRFEAEIELPIKSRVRLALAEPGLAPTAVTTPVAGWSERYNEVLGAGRHVIRLDLPLASVAPFVPGTAFSKRIAGKQVNTYHQIHINRLDELARRLKRPMLAVWADRWRVAQSRWGAIDAYRGLATRAADGRIIGVEEIAKADGVAEASGAGATTVIGA